MPSHKLLEIPLGLPDSDISYFPGFFDANLANAYFDALLSGVPWRQDHIKVYGKTYPQPRLTALYGNNGKAYCYSNVVMVPNVFTPLLLDIKEKVEKNANTQFTTCLLNLYRNGSDSNGWHADNEKELGKNPIIASVTLGQERYFHLKHRYKALKHKIMLGHGSLLVMKGETQHQWLHQIPKTTRPLTPRMNLTFRVLY